MAPFEKERLRLQTISGWLAPFAYIETGIIESFFGAGDKMIHLVLIIISAYFNLFLFIFMIIAGFAYDICRQEVV
jgi:hypothetical protein